MSEMLSERKPVCGYAQVEDGQLYYETCGSGPSVVLLHGFSFDRRMWEPQTDALSRHFRVIRYDLRGYGRSSLPVQPYSHADDLVALLGFLQVEKVHVVGLSLGGAVALDFALQYPRYTRSIVAADAALPGFPRREGSSGAMLQRIARRDGMDAAKNYWLGNGSLLSYSLRKPDVAQLVGQMVGDYTGWHFFNTDPGSMIQVIGRLDAVTAQTMVLVGEHDHEEFKQMGDFLHQQIEEARMELIADAAHLCNMDNPEQFNRLVISFLSGQK